MKRAVFLMLAMVMTVFAVPTQTVEAASQVSISFDQAEEGIVAVTYAKSTDKRLKVMIEKDGNKEYYNLFSGDEAVNYPLTDGDGKYTVSVLENTTGNSYKFVDEETEYVDIDEDELYLQSILEINWDEEDESIQLADELVDDLVLSKESTASTNGASTFTSEDLSEEDIINAIYTYVINNVAYDYNKINTIDTTYVPDNDATLDDGTGICYDYASLLASMLRSQGIQTKMVKGYANGSSVYHAWNEIYLADEGRWIVVDPTADSYRVQHGMTYTLEKDSSNYEVSKEF